MSIDYYASYPCKVRETVSDSDLLRMEKARNQVNTVLEVMRNHPSVDKSKPESEWTYMARKMGPEGPQDVSIRIGDAMAEAAPLESLAVHCKECPFNIRSVDFGCGGCIQYPISAQAEQWLRSRLPDDLSSPRGQLLTGALQDLDFDGAPVDAQRHRNDLYESSTPPERKWGRFFGKKTRITSSQILHMSFNLGPLGSTHARLIAFFLGFLDADFSLEGAIDDFQSQPTDDACIQQLRLFYATVATAGVNGLEVFIDA